MRSFGRWWAGHGPTVVRLALYFPRPHGELVKPRGRRRDVRDTHPRVLGYYTGITRRPVEERVWERNAGVVDGYTHSRRPVVLRCVEEFDRAIDAIDREQQIKKWSRRKKEALIARDYLALPGLAKGRTR